MYQGFPYIRKKHSLFLKKDENRLDIGIVEMV